MDYDPKTQRKIWRDKTTGKEACGAGAMAGWYASHPERYEQVIIPDPSKPCDGCKRPIKKIGRLCDRCLLANINPESRTDGRDPDACEAAMLADDE
jgi:hypothetical protein